MKTVLEQTIAPKYTELALMARVRQEFPSWAGEWRSEKAEHLVALREREEWQLADLIVCGSKFVANSLSALGVSQDRIRVVPYGVGAASAKHHQAKESIGRERKLRVLFVGSVGFRKGIHLLAEAASRLKNRIDVRAVGTLNIPNEQRDTVSRFIRLLGPVPRLEVQKHYDWCDVLVLPSICEGSATVTYEALQQGIPVVCSENAGSLMVHERSGLLVDPFKPESLVAALTRLADDSSLLDRLREGALDLSSQTTEAAYSRRLVTALRSI